MPDLDPNTLFPGTILVVAPHMDDEILACGGLIAGLSPKERIHAIYATDGMKSPSPILPRFDAVSADLGEIRIKESIAAMALLGVPQENLHFLRLPEAQLRKHLSPLKDALVNRINAIQPDDIFIPFRYDRHPDHLALNHAMMEVQERCTHPARLVEYFVYHRWRLLPQKDVRLYIKPENLIKLDITGVARQKRMALACFDSQTRIFFPWQTRPILTPRLLDEESANPEFFLRQNPAVPGADIFSGAALWIRFVHRVEPLLKDWKYLSGAFLIRATRRHVRTAG